VLVENGQKMRKYACIDAGNTALHMLYFLKVAHQLPEEAQKVASARLYHAYEMYKEAMRKEAFLAGIASAVGNAALSGAGKVIQNAAANPIRAIGLANSARPVGGISQNLAHARAQGGVIGGGHNQNFGGGGTP
jgi:RsiW-degrading membrane proteinase PrsW (M82 family)